jgi:peptidoglycan/LPS O-acetylase OafA/YrhL
MKRNQNEYPPASPAAGGPLRLIQALRAAACLLVVIYHALDIFGASARPPRSAEAIWPNAAAGVDLFFVISGLVMGRSARRLRGVARGWQLFLARRLRRILPLYWVLTFAKLGLLGLLPHRAFPAALAIAASLLFIPVRDAAGQVRPVLAVGWTLQFEMLFYAAVALCLALRRPVVAVMPALAVLAVAGLFRQPSWPAPLVFCNGLVLEFGLGVAASGVARPLARARPGFAWLLLAAGTIALLAIPPPGVWRFALWGLPAFAIVLALLLLEPSLGRALPSPIERVGDASYAIYLVHPFLVPVAGTAVLRCLPASLAGSVPHLAALTCLSLGLSLGAGLTLHEWADAPLQAWLSRVRHPELTRS